MAAEQRLVLARSFLMEATEQLGKYEKTGDELALRQACEKGWGAVAQAMMHVAGRQIDSHKEFGVVASELFRKTGDRIFLTGESAGALKWELAAFSLQHIFRWMFA